MNIASAVEEPALQADFFDEKGILKEYKPKSMYVLSGTSDDKPIMDRIWLWTNSSFF